MSSATTVRTQTPSSLEPTVAIPGRGALHIGRDPAGDIVLDHPLVSWRHAKIERRNGQFELQDLGSTNGTFIRGQRIKNASLTPGSTFAIASTTLYLTEHNELKRYDQRRSLALEVAGLRIDKGSGSKRITLLEGISLTVLPSGLVGIMGPSGAGKTTLLEALNGYDPPSAGRVLLNGRDLYQSYDQFRLDIGYVPQDDILHPQLTVRDALFYSARLRLPPDTRSQEIEERIARILAQLQIEEIAGRRIGSPVEKDKVLSGGQRKRVNLAMELLTEPWLLFLDEPTSGLSSADALQVLTVLRRLADEGRTVLLTIHQPSLEVFQQMTHLLMLAKDRGRPAPARLAYFGPAFPDALRFFKPDLPPLTEIAQRVTPDVIFDNLPKRSAEEWARSFASSLYRQRQGATPPPFEEVAQPEISRQPGLYQGWALLRRNLAIKRRDVVHTLILLLQAPLIGFLIVLVFGSEVRSEMTVDNFRAAAQASATALFLTAVATLWFGCSNAAREIVAERAIYHRERMVNLKIPSYLGAKLTMLGLLGGVQCAALLAVVHIGCGLDSGWPPMLVLLWLTALVGTGLGLILSALANTSEVAISLVPLILLPMVILGGIMQPVHKMERPVATLAQTMASRWAFEGLLLLESNARPNVRRPIEKSAEGVTLASGSQLAIDSEPLETEIVDMAEPYFPPASRTTPRHAATVLVAMMAGLFTLIASVLRFKDGTS